MATGERQREASLCDKSKQSAFLSTFYRQKLSCDFCDVVMKVCNREIHAHSNILAAASPYFESFLALEIPRQFSQKSPQIIEIQIDGSEPNLMYEVGYGYIFGNNRHTVTVWRGEIIDPHVIIYCGDLSRNIDILRET